MVVLLMQVLDVLRPLLAYVFADVPLLVGNSPGVVWEQEEAEIRVALPEN